MIINVLLVCYVFACISLIIFNVIYIFKTEFLKYKEKKRIQKWRFEICKQIEYLSHYSHMTKRHYKKLKLKLQFINELLSYIQALDTFNREDIADYLQHVYVVQLELSLSYSKKSHMKKAYFADIIAKYPPNCQNEYRPILQILISYLENSTIYCHENVLKALCQIGNVQAVENALSMFNEEQWYHHKKLISDNLINFQGNKEELMRVLWNHANDWNDNIMSAIVEFISRCHGSYESEFLRYLQNSTTPLEVRLAMIRYFRNHFYEPAKKVLYSFLEDDMEENENLTIVAASALDCYPDEKTILLLKKALHHHNWHVRYNAAHSLKKLNIGYHQLSDILTGNDNYAKEILIYTYSKQEDA